MYVIQFSVHEYVHAATGCTTLTVYVVYVCSLFGTRSCPLVSTLINSQRNKQAREDKVEELHGLPVKLKHSPPVFKEGNPQRLGLEMGKTMTFNSILAASSHVGFPQIYLVPWISQLTPVKKCLTRVFPTFGAPQNHGFPY